MRFQKFIIYFPIIFLCLIYLESCKVFESTNRNNLQIKELCGNWLGVDSVDGNKIIWVIQRRLNGTYTKFYLRSENSHNNQRIDIGRWRLEEDSLYQYCPNTSDTPKVYQIKTVMRTLVVLKQRNSDQEQLENRLNDDYFDTINID